MISTMFVVNTTTAMGRKQTKSKIKTLPIFDYLTPFSGFTVLRKRKKKKKKKRMRPGT